MSEWPTVRFENLSADEKSSITKPYGSAFTKADYTSDGIPMIRGVNLGNGIFFDDDFVFVSTEKADSMPGANLGPGDLIFTHRGTIGQVSMVPRSPRYPRYTLSTSQVKARLDASRALPEFYYYWFRSPAGQHSILAHISTVGVPGLVQPVATIKSLQVPHPPLGEQRAIAEVLGSLDKKIAANTHAISTSLSLSSSLFRFEISKNSSTVRLSEVVEFHNRQRIPLSKLQRKERQGTYPYYGAAGIIDHVSDFIFDGDYVLAGEDGSVVTPSGHPVLQHVRGKFWVSNHAHVLAGRGISNNLLFEALQIANVRSHLTGAVQPKLSMSNLSSVLVELPDPQRRVELARTLEPMRDTIRSREHENRMLAELRDTLLPQLVSGKIRVKDAERIMGDAA
ncbi:restriction endonuclease subunit S [Streptomyces californicus]|uniref:restriction endonuclease subunit S n=1 Tax=Streptomyces californicus TaxID=67351 RepID=UPI0037D36E93